MLVLLDSTFPELTLLVPSYLKFHPAANLAFGSSSREKLYFGLHFEMSWSKSQFQVISIDITPPFEN